MIYWKQNVMSKLTGGPGFPLIPGGPGKPGAPWKKKAIKCKRKYIVVTLEGINHYTLPSETVFKITVGSEVTSNI